MEASGLDPPDGFQGCVFVVGEDAGSDEEAEAFGAFEGEHAAAAGYHVHSELGVFPVFELAAAHIKWRVANFAQPDVIIPQQELAARKAHRRAAVAAAAGLMKHQIAVARLELFDARERRIGSEHLLGLG